MTIPVEQTRYIYIGPYSIGDTIPIPFSYSDETDVKLYLDDSPLEINVGYGVTGQNINVLTNIGSGTKVVVQRETPLDNDAEFPQEADFDSEKINNAFDKVTRQNQEQDEILSRAIKMPVDTDKDLLKGITFPSPNPNKAIQWNSSGTNLTNSTYGIDDLTNKVDEALDKVDGIIDDVSMSLEEIQRLESSSQGWANTSRSWAVGSDTERPEGSAKWWAQQTAQTVKMESYTKAEIDRMINMNTLVTFGTGSFMCWRDANEGTSNASPRLDTSGNNPVLKLYAGRYFRFPYSSGEVKGQLGHMTYVFTSSFGATVDLNVESVEITGQEDTIEVPLALRFSAADDTAPYSYFWNTETNAPYKQDTLPENAFFVGTLTLNRVSGNHYKAVAYSQDDFIYGVHLATNVQLDFIAKTLSETQWEDLSNVDRSKIALAFVVEEP